MPSLERITALCEGVGRDIEEGGAGAVQLINAATALLLAAGSLERRLADTPHSTSAQEQGLADLRRAQYLLQLMHEEIQLGAMDAARADTGEARRLILEATSMLLTANMLTYR